MSCSKRRVCSLSACVPKQNRAINTASARNDVYVVNLGTHQQRRRLKENRYSRRRGGGLIFPASPTLCSSRAVGELPVDLGLRGFAAVLDTAVVYSSSDLLWCLFGCEDWKNGLFFLFEKSNIFGMIRYVTNIEQNLEDVDWDWIIVFQVLWDLTNRNHFWDIIFLRFKIFKLF